jgi:hypothetical protein
VCTSVREEDGRIPFWLILHEHLSLGVVADVTDVDETSNVELGRAELRHGGWLSSQWRVYKCLRADDEVQMAGAGGQMRQAEPFDSLVDQPSPYTPQPQFGLRAFTHEYVDSGIQSSLRNSALNC